MPQKSFAELRSSLMGFIVDIDGHWAMHSNNILAVHELVNALAGLDDKLAALKKIEEICSDDVAHDIEADLAFDRMTDTKEIDMAKKLMEVYRLSHGCSDECGHNHPTWKAEETDPYPD